MKNGLVYMVAGTVALAATSLGAQSVEPGQDSTLILEEVIVTATKRESLLQNTALSVGVLTGQQLADMGAQNLYDYWRAVPSLVVTDQAFGGDRITIRGLGEEPNGISESMSAVYFDETPVNQADGLFTMSPNFELVDVDRIEVLRGPQGTLFGASAMGGAVRIISNSPDPTGSYGLIDAGLSSTSHGGMNYEASAMWNQALNEDSAIRFVGYYRDNDGWIDDIGQGIDNVNSSETKGARIAGSWELGERLRLTAKLQYQERNGDGFNAVDPVGKPELGILTTGDYQVVGFSPQFREDEATLISITAEYSADWGDLTYVGSWVDYDSTVHIDLNEEARYFFLGMYAPIVSTTDYQQETFVHELRLASRSDGPLQWLGGLYYLDQEVPRVDHFVWENNPIFPEDIFRTATFDDSREDWGLFGEVNWQFTEQLTATAGGRWYDIQKDRHSVLNGPGTGFQDVESSLDYSEDGFTPKFSLAWQSHERLLYYALASKGFRAGGANTPGAVSQCGAPSSFESDDLWNYELGLKSQSESGRSSLNISLYTIDWSDAQTEVEVLGCPNVYIVNAGEASSDGIEIEWAWLITDDWELRAAAGYNDSKITGAVPGSGIPDGAEIPLVPDITAAISTTWNFVMFGQPGAWLRADWQYTGETQTSLFAFFNTEQDAYNLFNLRLGLDAGRWSTVLFADNLLDEQASVVCCRLDGGFSTNKPRTIGVRARLDF